jgi:amino acid adenylation domain-containing protein/thioester reductase-like protein
MGLGDRYASEPGWPDARNDTATSYPADRSIADLFREQAGRTPAAIALSSEGRWVTYAELDRWSDRLAVRLVEAGVTAGEPVGLLGERCLEVPVGMLAIAKAGGVYVPLHRADPLPRLRTLIDELAIRRIVTLPGSGSLLDGISTFAVSDSRFGGDERPPPVHAGGGDPVYIMFTSGSTGTPKAVAVPHRAVARLVINTNYIRFATTDRVANTGSHSFDASTFEIWGALLNGARLIVIDRDILLDPARLEVFLRREEISVLWLSAGLFHQCARSRPAMFGRLRVLISGADVLIPDLVREVLRHGPPGSLLNGYGPTENTTFSTTYLISDVPAGAARIPIGRPIANSTCHIVAADGTPAGLGEEGELLVGGDGVALGYVNDPALTADRFIPDPYGRSSGAMLFRTGDLARWLPDGVIEFIGRRDRMIKLRDFRIELDEIEAVFATCPMVEDVAVDIVGDEPATRIIVGYYTPSDHPAPTLDRTEGRAPGPDADPPTSARLRGFLAERLPSYMLPGRFVALDRLPLTAGGKPDRAALAGAGAVPGVHGGPPASPHRPTTPEQVVLARLWRELLDVDEVGLDDTFFELGGNSLLAARIFARLQTIFGIGPEQSRFLTRRLLADPSLAGCAEAVREVRAGLSPREAAEPRVDFYREGTLDIPVPTLGRGASDATGPARDILLTGATGFLGGYLLRELLTTSDARIHCLVRAVEAGDAARRLEAAQARYGLGDLPAGRVIPLVGDLGRPLLGLDADRFDEYARSLDLILHAGAYVNFTYPYAQLATVTVSGTREVIRLACRYRGVPVHFISTIAVLAGFGAVGVHAVTEDTPLAFPEQLYMGYTETKWVAEALLGHAARAGLPVAIHRPYEVSGDLRTGAWNLESATCALIKVMVDSGAAPDIDLALDFVPVDLLAEQIVHIALTRRTATRTYHLANPQPAGLRDMTGRLRAHGYRLEDLPFTEWTRRVVQFCRDNPDHPFAPFVPLWTDRSPRSGLVLKEMFFAPHFPRFTRDNAEAALAGATSRMPAVDADLLDHYLRFFQRSGYLHTPPAGS